MGIIKKSSHFIPFPFHFLVVVPSTNVGCICCTKASCYNNNSSSSNNKMKLILANKTCHHGNAAVIMATLRINVTAEPLIKTRIENDDNDNNKNSCQTRRMQQNFVDYIGHPGVFAQGFPCIAVEAEQSRV
eukprot:14221004-Ditylum_brightwellii.AAC.1